jgi:hypothetical protein
LEPGISDVDAAVQALFDALKRVGDECVGAVVTFSRDGYHLTYRRSDPGKTYVVRGPLK